MADDPRPPRSFRRDVDKDIEKERRALEDSKRELRSAERARFLFGGAEGRRGFGGFGRTDLEMQHAREAIEGSNRALNDAMEYRRMYPDEKPVGSPGRPNVVYKKGGAVKAKKMASGGRVRGDGCAIRGKTKGKMV
jgi:hypothetical protein